MSTAEPVKQERMNIRLDTASKKTLEQAASYSQKSLSEFVIGRALQAANEVIKDHELISLNQADWDPFLNALEHPPAANSRLKQAFSDHRKRVNR